MLGPRTSTGIGLILLIAGIAPALAHHSSTTAIDMSQITEIEGSIIALRWVDPHVGFSVLGRNGTVWEVETSSIRVLTQSNVTAQTLSIGTEVAIAGVRAGNGEHQLYGSNLLLPDGTEIVLSPGSPRRWTGAKR